MIGSKLGHYEIVERIGSGGMGDVYRARDTKLDRDVALKILPIDKTDDLERIQRFEREAKAVASLNHPNIVTIHSVEQVGAHRFITMELIEGKTISELIPNGGLALERFFEIGIPMADALSAAHAKGVAHRDLKPSNIMVDVSGRLKVLDFGLAKLLADPKHAGEDTVVAGEQVTAEGKIVGTVAYMSPEQAESKSLDHRSDIFSLGVVLYEMATGDRPFQGDTPLSTMSAILRDTPTPVIDRKATLPRHLGRVIGRCLEKQPDRRFQTARDVCNELEGLQKEVESGDIEQLVSATMSGDQMAAFQANTRNRTRYGWIVAAVLLVAAGAYFFFPRGESGQSQRQLTVTPMSSLVGVETPGSWSPDGSFYAYAHSADGPTDIFIMSSAGGNPMPLVTSPYDDAIPRWSPDNRWIAFVSNRGQFGAIYLVPPLGGEPQLLVSLNVPSMSYLSLAGLGSNPWSPDGKKFVFARMDEGAHMGVWEIDLETREERRICEGQAGTHDFVASFSWAGDQIAFVRSLQQSDARIMLVPKAGGTPRELYRTGAEYVLHAFAPDDRSILYSPDEGGLWLVDVESGESERVTTGTNEHAPSVARDGRVLYSTDSHQTDLYIQDLASGDAQRLTRHTKDNFAPAFSPNGQFIAYESTRTGSNEIWLLELAGGSERRLTQREAQNFEPQWAANGQSIRILSRYNDVLGIWSLPISGGAPQLVGNYANAMSAPQESPDGSAIGFLQSGAAGRDLYAIAPEGGEPRLLLEDVARFGWYLDSNRIVYAPDDPARMEQIRVRNLQTGQDELLVSFNHQELRVAPDGSMLSFVSSLSHYNMNLHILRLHPSSDPAALPRVAGPVEKITHGDGEWHVHNGSFDSSASRVVYTRDTDSGDLYLLEGVF